MNVPHNRLDFLSTRGFRPLSTALSPGKRCSRHTCSFIFYTLCRSTCNASTSTSQSFDIIPRMCPHLKLIPFRQVYLLIFDLSLSNTHIYSSTNTYIHIWKHLLSDCSFENRRSSSIRRKDPALNRPPTSLINAHVFCGSGQPVYRGHGAP